MQASAAIAGEWLLFQSGPASAAQNMALDHALLEFAAANARPVLRFYSWTEPAATFGYFQKIADVEKLTMLRPLVRRPTGGGIVPHDADWTYSVTIPPGAPWYELAASESYRLVHEWVSSGFRKLGVETELAAEARKSGPGQCFEGWEKDDVLWAGRKIAGAAQRRNKQGLLIQGSVQPPPVPVSRSDWETAMLNIAAEDSATARENSKLAGRTVPSPPLTRQGVIWKNFQPTGVFFERANFLATDTYTKDEYNRKK